MLLAARGDGPRPALRRGGAGARRRAGRGRAARAWSPTRPRCSSRSPSCAATGATTARSWSRPGQLTRAGHGMFLSPDEILDIARQGAELGCLEALFTLGDRPEDRWPEAREWLDEQGYDSTLAYVRAMAIRVLEETGLLPHLNPGVMSWEEMNRLKPVSPSMGMMLETTSRRLFETKGEAHYGSPDKDPAVRLRVLEDAGRLSIPFTTGLLVGIGETLTERAETIFALRATSRALRRRAGGHRPELPGQARHRDAARRRPRPRGVPRRRSRSPASCSAPKARVQAPPNLVDLAASAAPCSSAGVDDWGGVSPLTPDHVNPERPWPSPGPAARRSPPSAASSCAPRLTVHPEYVRRAASRGSTPGSPPTSPPWPTTTASRAPAYAPPGCPGRSPTAASPSVGPHRPARRPSTPRAAPTTAARDFDDVYGDWDVGQAAADGIAATFRRRTAAGPRRRQGRSRPWPAAEKDPGNLSDEHALTLMTAEGDAARRRSAGSPTTCAATPSATRSPTSSTATSTSPTSATSAAGSARSPSAAPTPTPTRSPSSRSPTAPRRPGSSAPPRSACRAASTPSCPARRTSTSPPR